MDWTRRDVVKLGMGAVALSALQPFELLAQSSLHSKAIPSTGERVPVIGIGTRDFGGGSPVSREEYTEVLRRFPELGGSVIDTATGYQSGRSETLIGELLSEIGNRDRIFLATKVNASGKPAGLRQLEQSLDRLRTDHLELVAVHNIRDPEAQLDMLREQKQAGRIRYVGITTSSENQYAEFVRLMQTQTMDFVQVDYALDNRAAEDRILPLAADRGQAVMINLPFGRGRLFQAVGNRPLPGWAQEIDCTTWAQFFLKYVVSHPSVTCAIPGMRRVPHLLDNVQAAQGRMPDAAMRRRMEELAESL